MKATFYSKAIAIRDLVSKMSASFFVAIGNITQRAWLKYSILVSVLTGGMVSLPAYADPAAMAQSAGNQIDAFKNLLVKACLLVGVSAIAYGLKLMRDKANERADVKVGSIVWSIVGGALLCVIWFVVTQVVEGVGGSAGNIGQQSY